MAGPSRPALVRVLSVLGALLLVGTVVYVIRARDTDVPQAAPAPANGEDAATRRTHRRRWHQPHDLPDESLVRDP
jgi:hypothetical protein